MTERFDTVIVGARPAGAATALLLARRGAKVLVVDRSAHGSDTLSTHALMRPAVTQLHRWGVLERIVAAGTPPIRRTTFFYGDRSHPVDLRPRGNVDALYAPRRTRLDALLADAAMEAGAQIRYGVTVTDVRRDPAGRVTGIVAREERRTGRRAALEVHADLVVGADGARSRIARSVGAPLTRQGSGASGVVYGYWQGIPSEGTEWHYRPGVAAGLIPTDDDASCVFVSTDAARFRAEIAPDVAAGFDRLLAEAAPSVADRLRRARPAGRLRSFPGMPGFLRRPHGPGWALVGDAGYFKDPITAHGISDALRDAELLAAAASTGGFALYEKLRDEVSDRIFSTTDAIATYGWDLPELERLLLELSDAVRGEERLIDSLDPSPCGRIPC